jgi:hypothetical protein
MRVALLQREVDKLRQNVQIMEADRDAFEEVRHRSSVQGHSRNSVR